MEVVGLVVATVVVGLALWRGDRGTQAAAWATAAAWLVGLGGALVPRDVLPIVLLASDGLLASALLLIAIRYVSLWQGLSMLIQAAAFFTHAWALSRDDGAVTNAYFTAVNVLSFTLLFSILAPTLETWRRASPCDRTSAPRPRGASYGAPSP